MIDKLEPVQRIGYRVKEGEVLLLSLSRMEYLNNTPNLFTYVHFVDLTTDRETFKKNLRVLIHHLNPKFESDSDLGHKTMYKEGSENSVPRNLPDI